MKKITTRDVVNKVCHYLGDCSQKVVCRYLGVTPVALSQNIERNFYEILDNRVGKRLDALLYLLECVKKDETLEPAMLHRLITLPAYKGKDSWKIDVATAIHEEHEKDMIIEVFLCALQQLRRPVDKKPVARGLYQDIHH
ncbi:MAG: hypothetical protein AABY86_09680 [Bdellovibrionota bacterium]